MPHKTDPPNNKTPPNGARFYWEVCLCIQPIRGKRRKRLRRFHPTKSDPPYRDNTASTTLCRSEVCRKCTCSTHSKNSTISAAAPTYIPIRRSKGCSCIRQKGCGRRTTRVWDQSNCLVRSSPYARGICNCDHTRCRCNCDTRNVISSTECRRVGVIASGSGKITTRVDIGHMSFKSRRKR
jgi:hypothetical protein